MPESNLPPSEADEVGANHAEYEAWCREPEPKEPPTDDEWEALGRLAFLGYYDED